MRKQLSQARRMVIKVGSALLCDAAHRPRYDYLRALCEDIVSWQREGAQVAIVSSGAIALGALDYARRCNSLTLEEQQGAAAVGQIRLMRLWREAFEACGGKIAQILLTADDTKMRALQARTTICSLWKEGFIPIINENDSLATDEIKFGDNDRLAAQVASLSIADILFLLSDVDGLYERDPNLDKQARHIPLVRFVVDDSIRLMAGKAHGFGSGGMVTKLQAAELALASGCHMVIANGNDPHILRHIKQDKATLTFFEARLAPRMARAEFLKTQTDIQGTLILKTDKLDKDGHIWAHHISTVQGVFGRGAMVMLIYEGAPQGRGLVFWSSDDMRLIAGHKNLDFKSILGYESARAVIDRDDLLWQD